MKRSDDQFSRHRGAFDTIAAFLTGDRGSGIDRPEHPLVPNVNGDAEATLDALCEAQRRATAQRIAAERLLEETRTLEQRLSAEAEKARDATRRASAGKLREHVERARKLEQDAVNHADTCVREEQRLSEERAHLEAEKRENDELIETASAEVSALEGQLSTARTTMHRAKTARAEIEERLHVVSEAEATARTRSVAAAQILQERHVERERAEIELEAVREQASDAEDEAPSLPPPVDPPSLEPIAELHALEARTALSPEAARRVAERRAADAARGAKT